MADIIAINSEELTAGMIVVKFDDQGRPIVDAELKELLLGTRGCRGLHFHTTKKSNVCYLPGGRVHVLLK